MPWLALQLGPRPRQRLLGPDDAEACYINHAERSLRDDLERANCQCQSNHNAGAQWILAPLKSELVKISSAVARASPGVRGKARCANGGEACLVLGGSSRWRQAAFDQEQTFK
jgi:hypothetical protein